MLVCIFFSGVLDGRQMNLLHLQMLVPEKTPHLKCCSLMWRTLIQISPKDLVVSPGAKPEGKLLCFIFEGSSLTGQSDMRSVACMMFSTHQEREKLLHGSSLVLRPCSQIRGRGKFMAVKESAHCFQLPSLEFLYCSTLSSTLETLGFKTKKSHYWYYFLCLSGCAAGLPQLPPIQLCKGRKRHMRDNTFLKPPVLYETVCL